MLSSVSTPSQPPGFSPSGLLASEPLTSEQMNASGSASIGPKLSRVSSVPDRGL